MKKLSGTLKNKRVLLALALVVVVAIVGLSYAWFTSPGGSFTYSAQAGRLRVEAARFEDYENDDTEEIVRYYPDDPASAKPDPDDYTGTEQWLDSTLLFQPNKNGVIGIEVRNPNSDGKALGETVKVGNLVGSIHIQSDEDGNPVDGGVFNSVDELVAAYPSAAGAISYSFELDTANIRYVDSDTGETVATIMWSLDYNLYSATGEIEYYINISPIPTEYNETAKIDAIGRLHMDSSAGNLFQGAEITLNTSFNGTQSITGAIKDTWGASVNLVPLSSVPALNAPATKIVYVTSGTSVGGGSGVSPSSAGTGSNARVTPMTDMELAQTFFPELFS